MVVVALVKEVVFVGVIVVGVTIDVVNVEIVFVVVFAEVDVVVVDVDAICCDDVANAVVEVNVDTIEVCNAVVIFIVQLHMLTLQNIL